MPIDVEPNTLTMTSSAEANATRRTDNRYKVDFYTWTQRQAALIWSGRLEEIESLGRSQAASLELAYRLICLHQLKRMFQPERAASRSWSLTIGRERLRGARLLRQNPGLKPNRHELFESAYADARLEAALETGLPPERFPEVPPFTLDQAVDDTFWAGDVSIPAGETDADGVTEPTTD